MIAKTSAFAVHPSDFPPDSFELKGEKNGLIKRPNENFVLCKDKKGLPTAIYGDAIWNFKSYQTTKKGYSTFKFPESMHCIDEIKWLLFLNIYCADNSHLGKIGIETLSHRFHFYRSVANYCYKNGITVFEFFTDEKSIVQYVKKNQNSYQRLKQLKIAIRFHMVLTENIAGFRQFYDGKLLAAIESRKKHFNNKEKQTVCIPPRLFIDKLGGCLKSILGEFMDNCSFIESFVVACVEDVTYARSKSIQLQAPCKKLHGKRVLSPFFIDAATQFGLEEYFAANSVYSLKSFKSFLTRIRAISKCSIMYYTGMRQSEALSLKAGCLTKTNGEYWIRGITTKQHGKKVSADWCTHGAVCAAIDALESMVRMTLNFDDNKDRDSIDGVDLFLSPEYMNFNVYEYAVQGVVKRFNSSNELNITGAMINSSIIEMLDLEIQPGDIDDLERVDPFRDWRGSNKYKIGNQWPLASHQFRRSLVVYMAQSGLVRLTSLQRQLKHNYPSTSLYYCRGASSSKKLAVNDLESEIRVARPELNALLYVSDVLCNPEQIFGGHGTGIEKNHKKNPVVLYESVQEVKGLVRRGMLAYEDTSLGGCCSLTRCDDKLLNNFSACIRCDRSVLVPSKIAEVIDMKESTIQHLKKGSVEYRMECLQLSELKAALKERDNVSA